ncbi:hypothetical protein C0Q44_16905 [Paenibacillus sp. PCH8]|uniref:hypothetical protein n=1 Tax=Paenibacillus sp. PCH8 TaxID=2066524 RepID=UPI000CF9EF03|nr:hypothetical protein [Paenibacillus sp. PCH8]PQP83026.1 hypothetical protein C0Q44_16905 [Paenibacillus sp. PCH8]
MKTWTGILLMIILAVATISTTSAARTMNESQKQLNIDDQSSQTEVVEASNIEQMHDTAKTTQRSIPVKEEYVSIAPENENVRVYPMKVEGSGYIYNGMILEVNGKSREFSEWQGEGGSYKPEVHELDLNGDGQKEIVVLYTEGHGTGIYKGQARIIDSVTLEEMKMQSLDEIVKQHVESKVTVRSDRVVVDVAVDGVQAQPSQIEEDTSGGIYNEELGFGGVTYYSVEDGQIVVSAAGSYGLGLYAGDLTFAYAYQDGEWKAVELKYSMEEYEEEYYESFD